MIDFLVNLTFNLAPKTHQKSIQEPPKIDKKGIENMMQVGLGFGTLFGRFLLDFGTKLAGKLEPSWDQNRENWGPKTMSKNHQKIEANMSHVGSILEGFWAVLVPLGAKMASGPPKSAPRTIFVPILVDFWWISDGVLMDF